MQPIPKRLVPNPIVEAVVEVRFSSSLPSEAIFGMVYSQVGNDFDGYTSLPITQIPEAVRTQDPNLRYHAHYALTRNGNINLKIGPRVLTFSNSQPYLGWNEYFPFIKRVISELRNTSIIQIPERVGIRYINLFEQPIFSHVELDVAIAGQSLTEEPTAIRTELSHDEFVCVLNIKNNTFVETQGFSGRGSVIDIDCIYTFDDADERAFFDTYEEVVERGHRVEKQRFFELLKPEFLSEFNPVYD